MERTGVDTAAGRGRASGEKRLLWAAVFTLLWGAVTYLYAFLNFTVSHDSLGEFYGGQRFNGDYLWGESWKIALGRFLVPVYQKLLRGQLTVPWLIGVLSLAGLVLIVCLLTRAFDLSAPAEVFLLAGSVVTCPAVFTAAGAYIHDMDSFVLAILMNVLAVVCWNTGNRRMLAPGAVCICVGLGLYQSDLSIAVMGVMALSLVRLAGGERAGRVLVRGLEAIGMILAGLLMYAVALRLACRLAGVSLYTGSYNSITNLLSEGTRSHLGQNLLSCYRDAFRVLLVGHFGHGDTVSPVQCVVLLGTLAALIGCAARSRIAWPAALLMAALAAALPLGANLSLVANDGSVHDLMKAGFAGMCWLSLLAVWPWRLSRRRAVRWSAWLVLGCLGFTLWQSAVDANHLYLKKDLERQATLSLMTRAADDLEKQAGYVPGETPVAFLGTPGVRLELPEELRYLEGYTGGWSLSQITDSKQYGAYFRYVLQLRVNLCDDWTRLALEDNEQVRQMPAYPQEGSVRMVDGVLVVKMSAQ